MLPDSVRLRLTHACRQCLQVDLTLRHPSLQFLVQTNMTGDLALESEQTLSGYRHNFSEHDN